jgi:hypothetical protein
MKKIYFETMIFFAVLAAFGIANMLNPVKPTISEVENRALAGKPVFSAASFFRGKYFEDYNNYYNDTFVLRDEMILLSRDIRDAFTVDSGYVLVVAEQDKLPQGQQDSGDDTGLTDGKDKNNFENSEETASAGDINEAQTPHEGSETIGEDKMEETSKPGLELEDDGNMGYWLLVDGKAVELFRFNQEAIDYYVETINMYHEKLGDTVKLYSMIAPTAGEFTLMKRYQNMTDSQNEAMIYINSKLHPDIKTVDVFNALSKHKNEYIYFRTDHHWTALGAYYAYEAFMNTRGEEAVPLERYETVTVDNFLGSAYTKTLSKDLENNPDTIQIYLPFTKNRFTRYSGNTPKEADVIDLSYAEGKDKYLVFISSGGGTWSVIQTDVKNGKKLLIMKDSFGNAIAPFFMPHYEEIYIIDSRFYSTAHTKMNIPQFIEHHGIQEVAFIHYMEDVNWAEFMQTVRNLLFEDENTR